MWCAVPSVHPTVRKEYTPVFARWLVYEAIRIPNTTRVIRLNKRESEADTLALALLGDENSTGGAYSPTSHSTSSPSATVPSLSTRA